VFPDVQRERGGVIAGERVRDMKGPELAVSQLISAGLYLPCSALLRLPHLDAVLGGGLQPSADPGEYG
jgi:hypothetical protein